MKSRPKLKNTSGSKRKRAKVPKAISVGTTTAPSAKPNAVEVKIIPAKGRPMLSWVGKRPLKSLIGFPAQAIEKFDPKAERALRTDMWRGWPEQYPKEGLLFHGDNKEVLAHLLANGFRGTVDVIYIDPPFDSGADYVRKVSLRGTADSAKVGGDAYSLGEQIQYEDIWSNDSYLQFMYERLLILRELLKPNGNIFVHCDWNIVHRLRCVMDEVFMSQNFVNEIIWQHAVIGAGRGIYRRLPKAHETIMWYAKGDGYVFNTEDADVRVPYKDRITQNLTRDEKGYYYTRGRTGTDNPWSREPKYLRTYVDIEKGKLVHDTWDDITTYRAQGDEYVGYPTQKPEELISRILALASCPGDLVLDCFIGSGTTAAVAQKIGRRWIGCDINKAAIQTTVKRLQKIITEQIAYAESVARNGQQAQLIADAKKDDIAAVPMQLGFVTYRVNDYDLAIQHNEAVNLACELIGVERVRTDVYFDGKLGDAWVKIIPFGHPLSPTDLEELKRELDTRKEDPKLIKIVCLGMELSARIWVEEWNKLRKGKQAVNRIEVIELRTDAKYGKFIAHKPAQARVSISRKKDTIQVEIKDFISPTIVERLQQQAGILKPKIEDWRAMVDCVMIDTAFNGEVFNVALTDIPERKTDFVQGTYELSAPDGKNTVAVKISDMLGEEVLTTAIV
jgi:DNA modification methylase